MAALLVTLDQAKTHLRITGTDNDADVQLKLDHAESLVLDYVGSTEHWRTLVAGWLADPTTAPPVVLAAILVQLGELERFRGDDDAGALAPRDGEDLAVQVRELLRRTRDPVLA